MVSSKGGIGLLFDGRIMSMYWLFFPLIGIFAGLGAGMFGIGGGFLIVAALGWVFVAEGVAPAVIMHLALGTSLASIVLTSLSSLLAHHRRGAVLWPVARRLAPAIVIGTLAGSWLAGQMNTVALRVFFGGFALLAAIQIGLDLRPAAKRSLPGIAGMSLAGIVIGLVSALAGIGGGAASNPFFLWCNVRIHNAVATAAACGFPIALAGTAGFIMAGADVSDLPRFTSGYVYWPAAGGIALSSVAAAPAGAMLAHAMPVPVLRKAFAVLLAIIGMRMILSFA